MKVNDVEYARGEGARPDHGRIGWICEAAPIRFRDLKIRAAK